MAVAVRSAPRIHPVAVLRASRGMSQEALAAAANIHPETLRRIEGFVNVPRHSTVQRLATALGLVDAPLLIPYDHERQPGPAGAVREAPLARDNG